ncbi:EamA family transporter [Amnibacterium flavum]|uniref:EamA domain-containing protein n=1 Tax=Amnibacterium flavum TaxID=2173173 RepID=A0A2V1HS60_9MICO|nr:DMT family transporter [Amnibacterium flavum]PVZ93879.1 hypothetical protein DDQ50_08885 [Amnibacterium flavum]
MTGILLALIASVAYGSSDFFGAVAARRRGSITATAVIYCSATVVAVSALLFLPWSMSPGTVVAGVLAGLFGIAGFVTFYGSLAIGPMSVLSPSIALINTLVPIVAAVVLGDSLNLQGWVGVAAAVIAGLLVAAEPRNGQRVLPRGLLLAVASGLLLGGSIVSLDAAPEGSGALPASLDTLVGLIVIGPVALVLRGGHSPAWLKRMDAAESSETLGSRAFSGLTLAAGVLLGASNVLIVLALQSGQLAVVSVLVNLYPVVTVVLAALVLRERLAPTQIAGVALAIVAAGLLSLA